MRMRRGRSAPWIRSLLAEHVLTPADFIWPLFIADGDGGEEPIATLPGLAAGPSRSLPSVLEKRAIWESRASPCSPTRQPTCAPSAARKRSIPTS